MKRISLGVIGISGLLIATPLNIASAADMPLKAPPPAPAPVFSWTGCYVGGNIGYSWGRAASNYYEPELGTLGLPVPITQTERLDGVIGGGQIGCNWQANNTWVLGLETDFQGSGEKGRSSISDPYAFATTDPFVTVATTADLQWFGTVRGLAGVLINPTTLLYGTGGLAYGRISVSGSFTNSLVGIASPFGTATTNVGWTVGAGIKGVIPNTTNWTWKLEYLYIDFGSVGGNGFTSSGFSFSYGTKVTDNILRVGLDYWFGGRR
jgi:outer membrane immunogenic protein